MSEDQVKYEVEKQSIETGMSTRGGLVPSNLEQMWRLAVIMAKSGLMPKGLQTPEAVCVAVQMGLEVGLTPMQAVQNIAVINGRPAVWGDSGIALVEASGLLEDFRETITEDNGVIKATCWAKRKNRPTPVERTFTTMDAKQAGLHGKEGPWRQYPKRMTQMRARWWVLRDLFADVLKGLKAAEEVQDILDVTPHNADIPSDDLTTKIHEQAAPPPADPPANKESAESFPCPHCAFKATSERGLKKHMTQSHKDPDPPKEPLRPEDEPPHPAQVETDVDPETAKFLYECEQRQKILEGTDGWETVLRAFDNLNKPVSTPSDVAVGMRSAFIRSLDAQIDKLS